MKLTDMIATLPFYRTNSDISDIDIVAVEADSRKVRPGTLFVCIKGFTVDGHDFIPEAIENGAVAILAEKDVSSSVPVIYVSDTSRALAIVATHFYDYPTNNMPLIGVTGTNGKTTTTYVLETIFNHYDKKTGLIGTIQLKIGDDTRPIQNTTPNALFLQKAFREMRDQDVDVGIMEVSSHALDMGRVFGCDYDVAVFTNLSQDHLDYHKNMDDYIRAKSLLFSQLGNTYVPNRKKYAIINHDDPHAQFLKTASAQHIITYGCRNKSQVMAKDIRLSASETRFTLYTPVGSVPIKSKLIGTFNVYNMLAASAAAIALGVELPIIKQALEQMEGVSGRFETVAPDASFTTIVDYAHTPDSLENVLQTIKEFSTRNVYVVVGCGGDRDKTKRPLMASVALKYADWAIFTSDNPRTEDPAAILADMTADLQQTNYDVIIDRKQAIEQAIDCADADDIVLIAGKGHETYQQIGHKKYPFDDRKIALEAIQTKEN